MTAIASPDSAAQYLVAAAEYCEALEAIVEIVSGKWLVHFETGGECLVEWASHPNRLVATAGVGEPVAAARSALHASCLTFNALWNELGGMRLAKDDESEQLLLINELPREGDDLHAQLANALLKQEGLRLFWTLMVDNATGEEANSDAFELHAMNRA